MNVGHLILACGAISAVLGAPAAQAQAANVGVPFAASRPIAGRFIVLFKPGVGNPVAEANHAVRLVGGQLLHTYSHAVKGFAANLPAAALQGLRNNPNVALIEQDQTVGLNQVSPQNQATWGLDRIDQADRPLDTQFHFNYSGAGVSAFIIDTGIRADHTDLGGRVSAGFTSITDGNGSSDCNGHGTHVAGTVGGAGWGVAKGVDLIPVRVLDCAGAGTWSGVIAGVDWVAASPKRPAVANMSLGGGASASVDAAVAGAVSKGVTMVVAAGNDNADACKGSPAREPSAITVGATTSGDARASYSNYGSCVDIFGPGSGVTSAWHTSATATNTISGTSMAAPHVAGVAALALAANALASPAAVVAFLTTHATPDRLSAIGTGSPNKLVYALAQGAPVTPVLQAVAVKSLIGTSNKSGANWRASVSATVRDLSTGAGVPNATVAGSFNPGDSSSCVTGNTGSCSLTSAVISRKTGLTVFTVVGVSGANLSYDSSQNSASQIIVVKP